MVSTVSLVFLPTVSAVSFVFSPTVSAASLVFSPAVSSPSLMVSPAFFAPCFTSCSVPSCAKAASAVAVVKTITRLVILVIPIIPSLHWLRVSIRDTDRVPRLRARLDAVGLRLPNSEQLQVEIGLCRRAFHPVNVPRAIHGDECERVRWQPCFVNHFSGREIETARAELKFLAVTSERRCAIDHRV